MHFVVDSRFRWREMRLNEMSACFSVSDETCARASSLPKVLSASLSSESLSDERITAMKRPVEPEYRNTQC